MNPDPTVNIETVDPIFKETLSNIEKSVTEMVTTMKSIERGMKELDEILAIWTLSSSELCKFFADGKCTRGNKCGYAHSTDELRIWSS